MKTLLLVAGYILAFVAVIFGIYGLNFMYDNSYSAQIVGGDAYNYIIYATRGTAYVGAGIICAGLSIFCAVSAGQIQSPQVSNT